MRKGWEAKSLGEVCDFQRGLTYAKGDEVDLSDNIVLRATNIDIATSLLDLSELRYIADSFTVPENKKVKKDSLLICTASGSKSHLGKVAYIDADYGYAFGGFMGMLTPHKTVLPRFLFHLMTSADYRDFIGALSDGANINNLKFDDLKRLPVPVPPLAEQKRIVALLDQAFDAIATAKAHAEKNLQNARALFDSHLNAVFSQRGEGWVEKSLGDIAHIKGGKRVPKGYKLLAEPTGFPYLRVTEFTDGGTIDTSDLHYISPSVHREIKNYVIYSTDLYISIAGTIGKTGIIPEELDGANLTENACRLVFNPGVSNRFVYYFTVTPDFVAQAGLNTRTAAQPKLALSRLSTIKLGIPPLAEQKKLAAEFDALREEIQRLESIYKCKLASLDILRKSFLHEAFSGRL